YLRLEPRLGRTIAASLTIVGVIVPVLVLLPYSSSEIKDGAGYVSQHQDEIARKIDVAIRKLPFMGTADTGESIRNYVLAASNYGTRIPGMLRSALSNFAIAATIFVFTTFYVLIDADEISAYFRSKVPPRYTELMTALESN